MVRRLPDPTGLRHFATLTPTGAGGYRIGAGLASLCDKSGLQVEACPNLTATRGGFDLRIFIRLFRGKPNEKPSLGECGVWTGKAKPNPLRWRGFFARPVYHVTRASFQAWPRRLSFSGFGAPCLSSSHAASCSALGNGAR